MKSFVLIAAFVCSGTIFAQIDRDSLRTSLEDATFEDNFRLGNGLMLDLFYSEALMVWDHMLTGKPTNAHLNYRAGLCLVSMNREAEALTYFEKAQYGVSSKFDPYSADETHAPPAVYFFLALSNHIHGNIDTAFYQYEYFLSNIDRKDEMYKDGELGIAQLRTAKRLMANPKELKITDLGHNINTSAPEYSPVVTIDGSALFFTAKRLRKDSTNKNSISVENGQYYEDIYVSYRDDMGNWSEADYIHFSGPEEHNASVSTSPDGQRVFVYEQHNGGDLYYSKLIDTVYSHPEHISIAGLNTEFWEPHLTINAFEDEIYFVSDRPGGYGGRDIYRIKKLPDGSWSEPYNLPPPINSAYEEDAPFIGADDRTLYFSSNGPNSMGGFDIFMAHKDEDGFWSAPINMGYPLNSVDDDVFYTTTADGLIGFYSSDKLEGKGDKDIYMVETEESRIRNIAILKGLIYMKDS
ncbi:PD40 domain-containing protein, partial [Crocinitomix catalasitica]|nr:PD40 domain-containing protein [Crocinitomix catalasitica]